MHLPACRLAGPVGDRNCVSGCRGVAAAPSARAARAPLLLAAARLLAADSRCYRSGVPTVVVGDGAEYRGARGVHRSWLAPGWLGPRLPSGGGGRGAVLRARGGVSSVLLRGLALAWVLGRPCGVCCAPVGLWLLRCLCSWAVGGPRRWMSVSADCRCCRSGLDAFPTQRRVRGRLRRESSGSRLRLRLLSRVRARGPDRRGGALVWSSSGALLGSGCACCLCFS